MKLVTRTIIGTLFCAVFPAHAGPQPTTQAQGFELVSRCSNAARIATRAAEAFPSYRADRDKFIQRFYDDVKASGTLGAQLPNVFELTLAQISMETLLDTGIKPSTNAHARDWVLAQTAATCVLKTLQPLGRS